MNDAYKNANVEQWVGRLEAHDRAIFKYRHAIVATLGLAPGMVVADVGAGQASSPACWRRRSGRMVGYAVDIAPRFLEHVQKTVAPPG